MLTAAVFRNNQICQADVWITRHFQKKCNISFIFYRTTITLSEIVNHSVGFTKQSKLHHYWFIPGSPAPCQKLAEIFVAEFMLIIKLTNQRCGSVLTSMLQLSCKFHICTLNFRKLLWFQSWGSIFCFFFFGLLSLYWKRGQKG